MSCLSLLEDGDVLTLIHVFGHLLGLSNCILVFGWLTDGEISLAKRGLLNGLEHLLVLLCEILHLEVALLVLSHFRVGHEIKFEVLFVINFEIFFNLELEVI